MNDKFYNLVSGGIVLFICFLWFHAYWKSLEIETKLKSGITSGISNTICIRITGLYL